MRPLAVVIFAALIFGSLYAYLKIAERPVVTATFSEVDAEGSFDIKLTIPFDAEASAFDINEQAVSLLVKLDGREIARETDPVERGEYSIRGVTGLKIGRNEIAVEIQPSTSFSNDESSFSLESESTETQMLAVPIRVRVFRNDIEIGSKTTWNEPGLRLISTIIVDLKEQFEADE